MKFWELVSAFRAEKHILKEVLKQDKWKEYYKHYKIWDHIVRTQQRDILDQQLSFELCYEVAERSTTEYWLGFDQQPQMLYNFRPDIDSVERLLPAEILVRFGGSKIEDVHERAYSEVEPRALGENAEVIGSYNLTTLGLLAILRTEKIKLADNCILSTQDGTKKWKVKKEHINLFGSPVSFHEKIEAQTKQNIFHYLLDAIAHTEKPRPGDLLRINSH